MARRKMEQYDELVEAYEDDEAAPVVHQRSGVARLLMVLIPVVVLAAAAVGYVNRETLAAPSVMAYSEDKDTYQTDEQVHRQRSMYHIKASMNCDDVKMEPLGPVGGVWHVECVQER